ncbi:MAG: type II toxin-antitoxin system RelE/ParE family toxin [Nostocaceae cyanobacterium]|nr:type II toxin-antitoxin system RelE/ParE family toxin [Nostocaceae cyanobacterium]
MCAAEETFKLLGKMPKMGKLCQFSHPNLSDVRQQAIKGFKKYLVFYREIDSVLEIFRVIHGARDIEEVFLEDNCSD